MLGDITRANNIFVVTGYTDMRRSIDGLMSIVIDHLHMMPDTTSIYLFCGKTLRQNKSFNERTGWLCSSIQASRFKHTGPIPLAKK